MLADTAKLAIELNLTGNAKSGIAGVERQLSGLSRQSGQIGQGFKTMGTGMAVAFRNLALLAVPVVGGLAAGLIKSVKEGQEAAKVQTVYATAITNSAKSAGTLREKIAALSAEQAKAKPGSKEYVKLGASIAAARAQMAVMGPVTAQQTALLNKQQTALMNLAGIDDELIKTTQTRLIQMGLNGDAVARLTPLILDMSTATGKDLLTSTLAVGKAVNGNTAGLQRFGIVIDKEKAKTDAYGAVVDALNKKFGGTTKALSGSLEARLGALREGLANVREEAGIKLLPALTKIVDIAGRKLVPAFGQFIDRILPAVISGLDKFSAMLEGGGAERAIQGITDALGPMVEMLKIAAAPVKLIVDAFMSLPSQVQGVLIGAFAINKLSGGLIGQGAGQVVKGALGGILGGLLQRGSSPANPMYVSDIAGGLVGKLGGAGAILKATIIGAVVVEGLNLWMQSVMGFLDRNNAIQEQAGGTLTPAEIAAKKYYEGDARYQQEVVKHLGRMPSRADYESALRKAADYADRRSKAGTEANPGKALDDTMQLTEIVTKSTRRQFTSAELAQILQKGILPTASPEELKGILERGIAAGFKPKGGVSGEAVANTYRRNILRKAERQRTAINSTRGTLHNDLVGLKSLVGNLGRTPITNIYGSPNVNDQTGFVIPAKSGKGSTPKVNNSTGFVINANTAVSDIQESRVVRAGTVKPRGSRAAVVGIV